MTKTAGFRGPLREICTELCQLCDEKINGSMVKHPCDTHAGVSKHKGTPKNGWFIMENPFKIDDLGGNPLFSETPNGKKNMCFPFIILCFIIQLKSNNHHHHFNWWKIFQGQFGSFPTEFVASYFTPGWFLYIHVGCLPKAIVSNISLIQNDGVSFVQLQVIDCMIFLPPTKKKSKLIVTRWATSIFLKIGFHNSTFRDEIVLVKPIYFFGHS